MAQFNPDFWEVAIDSSYLENVPAEGAMWFETEQDRDCRHAQQDFFRSVLPIVDELIDGHLTTRQQEVVRLYFFEGKTQEDIAEALKLTQSTVSRHLFGTVRNGKKVGGAVNKLRKAVERDAAKAPVDEALAELHDRFNTAA
ncbi:MAG: ArsR family transcriptional regulator [bacterium]|nr:ArsR family transcriptional regulator [bacterium]